MKQLMPNEERNCMICGVPHGEEYKVYKTLIDGKEMTFCLKHYRTMTRYGREYSIKDQKEDRTCDICGIHHSELSIFTTEKFGSKMDLCKRHYAQMLKKGKISKVRNENEIIERDGYLEIVLYNRDGEEIDRTKISKQHRHLIKGIKWYRIVAPKTYYVHGRYQGEIIKLHRLVASSLFGENSKSVDHINRDGLDNRGENLRYATRNEQLVNQSLSKRNRTGVKGVFKLKHNPNKWKASITYQGETIVKTLDSFEEAVEIRKQWEHERDKGEWLNFVEYYRSNGG